MDRKLAIGIWLIVVSLVIGVAFKFYVLSRLVGTTSFNWLDIRSYFEDPVLAWASAAYLVSWPMLFVGAYLAGSEGVKHAERFTKYLTHKYYVKQAKEQVPRIAKRSVEGTRMIAEQTGRMAKRSVTTTRGIVRKGAEGLLKRRPPRKREKSI